MAEQQLTSHLINALQEDFDIRHEVKGYNLLTRSPIRADVVAHPKPHLVAAGFVDAHFCIEVKAVPTREPDKRARAAAWQALSYRLSEFDFGVPAFALVYPPFAVFYLRDGDFTLDPGGPTKDDIEKVERRAAYRELTAVMQRGNVGWVEISEGSPGIKADIRICFGAGRYWSKRLGMSGVKNLGLRLHVGTR
jgi:hypothetical protein